MAVRVLFLPVVQDAFFFFVAFSNFNGCMWFSGSCCYALFWSPSVSAGTGVVAA
jgi:hypothetical protein